MNAGDKLDDIEKAIVQVIIQHGTIEGGELEAIVKELAPDFVGQPGLKRDLKDVFRRINSNIRVLGLEIRSIRLVKCLDCHTLAKGKKVTDPCEDCNQTTKNEYCQIHAVTNMEDDQIAKDFGSDFNAEELQFFSELVVKLIDKKYLNSAEIHKGIAERLYGKGKWTSTATDALLNKLLSRKWLQKDNRSYWEIGIRSYIELNQFLRTAIGNTEADDEDDDALAAHKEDQLSELPVVIMY